MRGDTKLGCLIWLGIFVVLLYGGYKVGLAQWHFFSLKEELHELAKSAARERTLDQGVYQNEVIQRAQKIGITLHPEDITITETEDQVIIEVTWVAEIAFPGYSFYKNYGVTASYMKGF